MTRKIWGSRLGFYFAAIGAAFGLGNLWRFPYIVTENGGGAFVLLYMALVLLVGMPLLIGELFLGKMTGKSVIPAVQEINGIGTETAPRWVRKLSLYLARFSTTICFLVLAYFAVISGWVLHFFVKFGEGLLTNSVLIPGVAFAQLQNSGSLQVALTTIHLFVVVLIVAKDVEDGFERWIGYLMPAFLGLVTFLCYQTLSLQDTGEALRYFLYPDFSRLGLGSLGNALGHVFFTLSVGFGSMVTFGSYFKEREQVALVGFRVATLDSVISLVAGLLIFPLVFLAAQSPRGPELLFETVPDFLISLKNGRLFGTAFFLCLYVAALGASIGLLEAVVANVSGVLKIRRVAASWLMGSLCLMLSLVPALSSSRLSHLAFGGKSLLAAIDGLLINWLLPIAALGLSQVIASRISKKVKEDEFELEGSPPQERLFTYWYFCMRFLIPGVIGTAIFLQIVSLFRG